MLANQAGGSIIQLMKRFAWNVEKNEQLKSKREIAFEDIVLAIQGQQLLAILEHHNKARYPNQQIFKHQ